MSAMIAMSELTTDELEGQAGEFLPAREEMNFTFRRRVTFANIGNNSGNTLAEGQVVFGSFLDKSVRFNF